MKELRDVNLVRTSLLHGQKNSRDVTPVTSTHAMTHLPRREPR
ncbi:Unannotated, partial [Lentimonas sp. CC21]